MGALPMAQHLRYVTILDPSYNVVLRSGILVTAPSALPTGACCDVPVELAYQ